MHPFVRTSLFILSLFFLAWNAFGGGVYRSDSVRNSGKPPVWRPDSNGIHVVKWYSDPGPLTSITSGGRVSIGHDKAINEYLSELFTKWEEVEIKLKDGTPIRTTTIKFEDMGPVNAPNNGLEEQYRLADINDIDVTNNDIDVTNYERFSEGGLGNPAHPPPTVVIFDVDGSIIKDYQFKYYKYAEGFSDKDAEEAAKEDQNKIVGMGSPFLDSESRFVEGGMVILNGRFLNGVFTPEDNELDPNLDRLETKKRFQAMILHEIGHLINLDHSQVNQDVAESCTLGSECDEGNEIPTMYPGLKSTDQFFLHQDDKAIVSWLYPTQEFTDQFCTIEGEIKNKEGKGMQGVNVIAKNVLDRRTDARAMVSGVLYFYGIEDGHYYLPAILPGQDYEVFYEPLGSEYNKDVSSSFSPLGDQSPTDFKPGQILGPGGATSVRCERGGVPIPMEAIQVASEGELPPDTSPPPGGSAKKGWWCSLRPNSEQVDFNSIFPYISIYAVAIFIFALRFFVWCSSKRSKKSFSCFGPSDTH